MDKTRQIFFILFIGGVIFGAGIGAAIEHHFNRPVVVISPIHTFKHEGTDHHVISPQTPDEQKL
jgi:hypothetical protein